MANIREFSEICIKLLQVDGGNVSITRLTARAVAQPTVGSGAHYPMRSAPIARQKPPTRAGPSKLPQVY